MSDAAFNDTIKCAECGDDLIRVFASDHRCNSEALQKRKDIDRRQQEEDATKKMVINCEVCNVAIHGLEMYKLHIQYHNQNLQ